MAKRKNELLLVTPFIMLLFGLIAAGISTTSHTIDYLAASMTRVKHPTKPDFSAYDAFLHNCVKQINGANRVDYQKVKGDGNLGKAMKEIAETATDKFENDKDVILFWVNAHNLMAIKNIADKFPVDSAQRVSQEMQRRLHVVGGKSISVDKVWREKIVPILTAEGPASYEKENILYLLTRGTLSEPAITDHAVTAETMEADEEGNILRFVSNPKNVLINEKGDQFYISSWFQKHRNVLGIKHIDLYDYVYSLLPKNLQRENGLYCQRGSNPTIDRRINDVSVKE